MIRKRQLCVARETMVQMEDGRRIKIDGIRVGDRVLNQSGHSEKVQNIYMRQEEVLLKITTERDSIMTTGEHMFLAECGWEEAGRLSEGEFLLVFTDFRNRLEKITKVEQVIYQSTVYNLELERDHSMVCNGFVVGDFYRQNCKN